MARENVGLLIRSYRLLRNTWKRRVVSRPDRYKAYVSFPTEPSRSRASTSSHIEDLERVFEGRIDVYARTSGIAVVSDAVSGEQFDPTTFLEILDQINDSYAEMYTLATIEKWQSMDGQLVKNYVIVPVKPLFPRAEPDRSTQVRATSE